MKKRNVIAIHIVMIVCAIWFYTLLFCDKPVLPNDPITYRDIEDVSVSMNEIVTLIEEVDSTAFDKDTTMVVSIPFSDVDTSKVSKDRYRWPRDTNYRKNSSAKVDSIYIKLAELEKMLASISERKNESEKPKNNIVWMIVSASGTLLGLVCSIVTICQWVFRKRLKNKEQENEEKSEE